MGCITTILLLLSVVLLFIPGFNELVMQKEYWYLLGIFWLVCGLIRLLFGDIIDDVADLHFEVMINDKAPGKRFIASNNHMFFPEIAKVLNDNGFKAPKRNLPTLLARILGRFDKQLSFFLKDIDILRIYHSNNARNILGWKFRSSESAIVDAAKQINALL